MGIIRVNRDRVESVDRNKSVLYVMSGPSGSGKTTSIRQVMDNEVVSFTTRDKRVGEVEGVDYIFTTVEEIDRLEAEGLIVERVLYDGKSYGISKVELDEKLSKGDAFVVVDFHGYQQLQELYDNVVGVFFEIDVEDARERMIARGDREELIESRLKTYEVELKNAEHYDYVLLNEKGKQDVTVEALRKIINGENIVI